MDKCFQLAWGVAQRKQHCDLKDDMMRRSPVEGCPSVEASRGARLWLLKFYRQPTTIDIHTRVPRLDVPC